MTFKRKVLAALTRLELLEAGRAVELDVTTNMRHDDLLDVVAGSKKRGMMEKILPVLTRDTLKAICEAVGISQEGREKQVLIDRILVAGGESGGEAEGEGKTPSPVALRVPAAKSEAAQVVRDTANDGEATEPAPFSLTSPEPKAPKPSKVPAAKPRVKFTTGAKSADGTQVLSYRHADRRKNNPEVGMVDPETDPEQPKTTWAYDPHIDPALQFDVGRAGIEPRTSSSLGRMRNYCWSNTYSRPYQTPSCAAKASRSEASAASPCASTALTMAATRHRLTPMFHYRKSRLELARLHEVERQLHASSGYLRRSMFGCSSSFLWLEVPGHSTSVQASPFARRRS